MTRRSVTAAAIGILLHAAVALAAPSAQESCDNARVIAWKRYVSCVQSGLAVVAKGVATTEQFQYLRCRHAYFKKWTSFQTKPSLAGSTCVGNRFTNNGSTVTDNLTSLVWEKKTTDATVHDEDNTYTWSTGAPYFENGTVFTSFLASLNGSSFAGANGWRLPDLAELESIVLDFPCSGAYGYAGCSCASPCIDPMFGPTQPMTNFNYWTSTPYLPNVIGGRSVNFDYNGYASTPQKTSPDYARAVRGGL